MMDFFKKLTMCNNEKSFITNSSNPIDTSKVNRIELISQNGRVFVLSRGSVSDVQLSYQDNGQTLKIFYNDKNMSNSSSEWTKFEDKKPPHTVVLAACDTYDCGWTMDTVWWHEDEKCWMLSGSNEKAHLQYTHWRILPSYPNNNLK